MKQRTSVFFTIAIAFFVMLLAATANAQARMQSVDHGGTYFGSVIVEPGQVVDGDLSVVFGDATIEGTVNGDVNVVGGSAIERPGSTITGHVNTIGGEVTRSFVPWAPSEVSDGFAPDYRIMWRLAWDVVVVLFFLIFPIRTRMALDRLEQHPGLALAAGLLGWVAVIPVAILLCVTIILMPLVLVEGVALVAAVFIGKAALSLLVGRRLYELIQPHTTPSPLAALVIGLVLLTAAELVPVIGVLITILVGLVGLGCVLLAFVREQSFAGVVPGPTAPRPPISGPPMPAG